MDKTRENLRGQSRVDNSETLANIETRPEKIEGAIKSRQFRDTGNYRDKTREN